MAVNSYLICENIKSYVKRKLSSSRYECHIEFVTLYMPDLKIRQNAVYIVTNPMDLPINNSTDEHAAFIVIGLPEIQYIKNSMHDIICMDSATEIGSIFEVVNDTIEYYKKWENTLNHILIMNKDINKMCRVSVDYFQNSMVITSSSFELLAIGESEVCKYPYSVREKGSDYLSDSIILKYMPNAQKLLSSREPVFYFLVDGIPSLFLNIFINEQFICQICLDAVNRPFNDGDYTRICILGKYIRKYMESVPQNVNMSLKSFKKNLLDYVLKNEGSHTLLSGFLEKMNWKDHDSYICCMIDIKESDKINIGTNYVSRYFEHKIAGCVAFANNSAVYILCNLSNNTIDINKLEKSLKKICIEFNFRAGLGMVFNDFYSCQNHFKQASVSLKIGRKMNPSGNLFLFYDYVISYVLSKGMESLPVEIFIPDYVQNLINYDKEHNGSYCQTLDIFLQKNMNITDAAETLYIHRSTLKYRIKKIKEIVDIDRMDCDARLYLLMLFRYLNIQ